jgi:hypothetical protein
MVNCLLVTDRCFLCRLIAEDLALHGHLTDDYPGQGPIMMEPVFPVDAKIAHLVLEKFVNIVLDGTGRARILSVE